MGNALRRHREGTTGPRAELSPNEKTALRVTWKKFLESNADNGTRVFIFLFAEYPRYNGLFKDFKRQPSSALAASSGLRAHGLDVVDQISASMECLNHPDVFMALVCKNARSHVRRKGLTIEHFLNFNKVFLDVQTDVVGRKMTPDAEVSWDKFFNTLSGATSKVFVEAGMCTVKDAVGNAAVSKNVTPAPRDFAEDA